MHCDGLGLSQNPRDARSLTPVENGEDPCHDSFLPPFVGYGKSFAGGKVALERQQKLVEELDDETRVDAQREAKKAKEAQKKNESHWG